jgi:hypothetical protein
MRTLPPAMVPLPSVTQEVTVPVPGTTTALMLITIFFIPWKKATTVTITTIAFYITRFISFPGESRISSRSTLVSKIPLRVIVPVYSFILNLLPWLTYIYILCTYRFHWYFGFTVHCRQLTRRTGHARSTGHFCQVGTHSNSGNTTICMLFEFLLLSQHGQYHFTRPRKCQF